MIKDVVIDDLLVFHQLPGNYKRFNFNYQIRSVYSRVINNQGRTNNYAEAANRRIQVQLAMEHPTIWKFIDALKTIQKRRDKEYEEFVVGQTASQKKKKYLTADERIKQIVEDGMEVRTPVEYLRAIATNFSSD